eukprot:GHUV01041469.1.p1 GENE.GHUV01041469.1~~GHUV01041469.1.p1  ORF type:complete len:227 (-),score=58.49 GHUV01041469.1:62-742(-)
MNGAFRRLQGLHSRHSSRAGCPAVQPHLCLYSAHSSLHRRHLIQMPHFGSWLAQVKCNCMLCVWLSCAEQAKRRIQKVLRRGPRMQKKLGEVVYKGHYSYTLMLELQLGIRYSVGRSLRPRDMEKHSLIAQLGVLRPWWSTGSVLSSTGGHSSHSGLKGAAAGCFSALRHPHEDDEEQQHYDHQQQVHQHVQQQLEAVLAGATGGGALVEADFKEEITVFFPSSGR